MSYIGNTPTQQNFVAGADQFSGNGSTVAFTLSRSVNTVFDIFVTVANVPQDPFTAYTVAGNTLTFDGAPPSGTNNIDVVYRATNVQTFVPTPGVSTQLGLGSASAPSLTFIGDTNTGIYSPAADTVAIGTGGTEALRVNSSQQVGIGTQSPTTILNIEKSAPSASVDILVRNTGTDGTSNARIMSFVSSASGGDPKIGVGITGVQDYFWYIDNSDSDKLKLDSNGSDLLTVTSAGNVGFGVTNPGNRIALPNNAFIAFRNTSAAEAGYIGMTTGNLMSYSDKFYTNSGGDFLIAKTTNSETTGGFQVSANGSVASTLNANTYVFYNNTAGAYRFFVSAAGTINATSTTITAISDYRLKENIRDLDDGLDAVMALKPRKFDWKEGKGEDKKDARGFIAQELETVFPDMVTEWIDPAPEGEEPYKAVNANLIPTLVKAVQELNAKVEAQAAEIAALKAQP